jgi:hypothetical protein
METIREAQEYYPEDMQKKLNYLHFHLQDFIGKRIQIIIFERTCV